MIDPGNAVTVHFSLGTDAPSSRGKTVSLAAKYGYRIVKADDMQKDPDLNAAERLRQVRMGNISFPPSPVVEK